MKALVLRLDLAVAVLVADVAGGVVGPPAGERRRGGAYDECAGDHGGCDDATNIHWTLPIGCNSLIHRANPSGATSADGRRTPVRPRPL